MTVELTYRGVSYTKKFKKSTGVETASK